MRVTEDNPQMPRAIPQRVPDADEVVALGASRVAGMLQSLTQQNDELKRQVECLPHFESRRHEHVEDALGLKVQPGAVLLTDGYAAYERYASKTGITHTQCWTHSRRTFFEAQDAEPQLAAEALRRIGALYEIEEEIREKSLAGENKQSHRLTCWRRRKGDQDAERGTDHLTGRQSAALCRLHAPRVGHYVLGTPGTTCSVQ